PGQRLAFDHPRVRIFNEDFRAPNLSAKIQYLVDRAHSQWLCRWDDDDLHLPHRLQYSLDRVLARCGVEWRPENFWFHDGPGRCKEDHILCISHVMAICLRDALWLMC